MRSRVTSAGYRDTSLCARNATGNCMFVDEQTNSTTDMLHRVGRHALSEFGGVRGIERSPIVEPQLGDAIDVIGIGTGIEHDATNAWELRRKWRVIVQPPVTKLFRRHVVSPRQEDDRLAAHDGLPMRWSGRPPIPNANTATISSGRGASSMLKAMAFVTSQT